MSSPITHIPDRPTHDKLVAASANAPTVIYLCNSVLPLCKSFTPKYEALAKKYSDAAESDVLFTQMENTPETSPMFKFGPNQLPVVIFISEGRWARTLMSPTIEEVEKGVDELVDRVGKMRN